MCPDSDRRRLGHAEHDGNEHSSEMREAFNAFGRSRGYSPELVSEFADRALALVQKFQQMLAKDSQSSFSRDAERS